MREEQLAHKRLAELLCHVLSTGPGANVSLTLLMVAAGWGLRGGSAILGTPSTQLREAQLMPLSWEICKRNFENLGPDMSVSVTIAQICTQFTQGSTTCSGDSAHPWQKHTRLDARPAASVETTFSCNDLL